MQRFLEVELAFQGFAARRSLGAAAAGGGLNWLCFAELPLRCHAPADSATGGLPNQWIRPQRSHMSVVAVRFAQSKPKNVMPAVLSMADPLTNFVCLQWSH